MIKNLIFDLGGVVITLDHDEAVRRFTDMGIRDAADILNPYTQSGLENWKKESLQHPNLLTLCARCLVERLVTKNVRKHGWDISRWCLHTIWRPCLIFAVVAIAWCCCRIPTLSSWTGAEAQSLMATAIRSTIISTLYIQAMRQR